MTSNIEFIPDAGACLASTNVVTGAGRVKWMVREESQAPADNGWRFFSDIDTEEYLADPDNLQVVDFNLVCEQEPAVIGIWDFPVGSDLQIVDAEQGIAIIDSATEREIPVERMYVPPAHRA